MLIAIGEAASARHRERLATGRQGGRFAGENFNCAMNKTSRAGRLGTKVHAPDKLFAHPRGYFIFKVESEETPPNHVIFRDRGSALRC
jgi:hypothetical protein